MNTFDWFEVWADDGLSPPYVLVLMRAEEGRFSVYDPTERKTVHSSTTYAGAKDWLLEDEYKQVVGRMSPHDPDDLR